MKLTGKLLIFDKLTFVFRTLEKVLIKLGAALASLKDHDMNSNESSEEIHNNTKTSSESEFSDPAEKQLKYLGKLVDNLLRFPCFHEKKNRGE